MILKNKKFNKPLLIAGAILLVVAGGLISELSGITNFFSINQKAADQRQEAQTNADAKRDFIENGPGSPTSSKESTSSTESTDDNQRKIDLSTRQEEINNSVTVFTELHNFDSGTCNLTVTNADKTVTQSAGVIYQPEFSSCAGFSIPISQLGKGIWSINLTVSTPNSASVSKTITAEVR